MAMEGKNWTLIIIFICGVLVGLGIYSLLIFLYQYPDQQIIFTSNAPKPIGPYSQAVQYEDFVFISGQIGLNPTTGNLSKTAEEQTIQVMENLRAVLQEAGLDFSDVVQIRIYLTNMADWNSVNGIYGKYFKDEYPARATIIVAGLPKGAKVEIEMMVKNSAGLTG